MAEQSEQPGVQDVGTQLSNTSHSYITLVPFSIVDLKVLFSFIHSQRAFNHQTATMSASRNHVIDMPRKFVILRILQLVFAVILLGLSIASFFFWASFGTLLVLIGVCSAPLSPAHRLLTSHLGHLHHRRRRLHHRFRARQRPKILQLLGHSRARDLFAPFMARLRHLHGLQCRLPRLPCR